MATLTVRNLEDSVKAKLRIRAAQHGRSMEEEARSILRTAVSGSPSKSNLADMALELFGPKHGIDLPEILRSPARPAPSFD